MYFLGTIPKEKYVASKKENAEPLPGMHSDRYIPLPEPEHPHRRRKHDPRCDRFAEEKVGKAVGLSRRTLRLSLERGGDRFECPQHQHPAHDSFQQSDRSESPKVGQFGPAQVPFAELVIGEATEHRPQFPATVMRRGGQRRTRIIPFSEWHQHVLPMFAVVTGRNQNEDLAARLENAINFPNELRQLFGRIEQEIDVNKIAGAVGKGQGQVPSRRDMADHQATQGKVVFDQFGDVVGHRANSDVAAVALIL